MIETRQRTVAEIVAEHPVAARLFEKRQIDYCCNGKRPLDEVCAERGIAMDALSEELEAVLAAQPAPERDWSTERLGELIDHIVATHHEYLRQEMPWIEAKLNKLAEKHAERYPWVVSLRDVFLGLKAELDMHMRKEEMILFPFIVRMEQAALDGAGPVFAPFGSIRNPITMMEMEHDSAGNALREIRRLSTGYTPPEDACSTFRATLDALEKLEADLHLHIHLENNILFPRAIELQ